VEEIKGVGNDKKRLRANGSSNEKPQGSIREIDKDNNEISDRTSGKRQSEVQ